LHGWGAWDSAAVGDTGRQPKTIAALIGVHMKLLLTSTLILTSCISKRRSEKNEAQHTKFESAEMALVCVLLLLLLLQYWFGATSLAKI
jgi:hypothetical protein